MTAKRSKSGIHLMALALSSALSVTTAAYAEGGSLLIKSATVFDSVRDKPYAADVLVVDGRISAVGQDIDQPSSDFEIIDGSGLSLLPGLIDIHVHWTSNDNMDRATTATALVLSGVTTVTDFHSAPESYGPKRAHHETLISPHVLYTSRVGTPGGHGADWGDENMTRAIWSERQARAAVKSLSQFEPDVIKVFADGWRYGTGVDDTSINIDAFSAIVEEANVLDIPVLTHVVSVDLGKRAAKANVSAIVHAIQDRDSDKELVELLTKHNTIYAPTLAVYEPRDDKLEGQDDQEVLDRIWKRQKHSKHNLKTLAKNGVKIALGTDSGIASTPLGESTLRELELLVDFGLSPKEALMAGTANSAAALRLSDDRGTIESGKRADLVLVKGKPWKNISDFRNLEYVIIDGEVVAKGGSLTAEQGSARPDAVPAGKLIDDFESADGKTASGASRLELADAGHPRSNLVVQTEAREKGGHALHLSADMAEKNNARAFAAFPLSLGSFTPKDASEFKGVAFEIRGDGEYQVRLDAVEGRLSAMVEGGTKWRSVKVPFSDMKADGAPKIDSLLAVAIGGYREPGEELWVEIDNVSFY
ncbi:amidohydrolase family protein [Hyphococcus lacteus]|uniref:Amidohydrolase family protein n=1 Tax=Hyphococcus lacteus TaxID=3143536 RepID=A0ABV3ZAW4_9PROT